MELVPISDALIIDSQRVKPFDGEMKYLATGGLVGADIITEMVTYQEKPSRADLMVQVNNLIVARMKDTNKVLLIDDSNNDMIVSTGFLVLKAKAGWDPRFLYHYLSSSYFEDQKNKLSIGATQKAINNQGFTKILIPSLTLERQKKAAKLLDVADDLCRKRKESINLLDEYTKSVFIEMFGDPVKNTRGWNSVRLDTLLKYMTSGSRGWAKYFSDNGDFFLTIKNVGRGNKLLLDNVTYINSPNNAEAKRTKVEESDILMSITADLGRTAVVPKLNRDAYINQHLVILRLKENINPTYISHYLSTDGGQMQMKSLNKGAAKAGLNFNDIRSIDVLLPPIDLQNKYFEIVTNIESLRKKMHKQSLELRNQFQAITQKAFEKERA